YLLRLLNSLSHQTQLPQEVVLADDGSDEQTHATFESWAARQSFPCRWVWQEHTGFRRARILNLAIAKAASAYLVFQDGDTIPHPQFVADHLRLARPRTFIQGHRALIEKAGASFFGLGEFAADRRRALFRLQLRGLKHAYRWPRPACRYRTDLRGIRGCNLAIWRDDLIKVNGYNEAFTGWGREDSELAVRLMNTGARRLDVRGWAICYHLWHPPASRANLSANDFLLQAAQAQRATRCESGLSAHLPKAPR
ncbi:MAG: galactosyltransferase-related protein, partial [Verrucomicrobia bacterium]|nr:galactosyltransferase-related protein [Verrucomicrobiota bacterium]